MIESSPAYDNLLGVPGSSPIDLFWDLLDELERVAEIEQQAMEKILEEKGTEVGDETTYDQFVESFAGDERLAAIEFGVAKAVFERVSLIWVIFNEVGTNTDYSSPLAIASGKSGEE